MKRLIKKSNLDIPQIGGTAKITDDPKYVDCKSVWFAGGYRDGVIIVVNDRLYYGKGEHTDLARKIIYQGKADWDDKIYYGNYLNDFLNRKSIFLDDYNLECADIIAMNDNDVIVYEVVFPNINTEDGYFVRLK